MDEFKGRYVSNRNDVAAKVIDGELIVIRLSDGTYYSMDNVGTCVWALLEARHTPTAIAQTIAAWYALPADRAETDVMALVGELVAEGLVVATPDTVEEASVVPPPGEPRVYEAPRLQIYRDMGNLLALDPPTPGIDDLLFRNPKGD